MERLRELLSQISTQLGVLTVSQRLALGLCAALIAVSLLWLMQWSTEPDLVPLVNYEFSFEELAAAEDAIAAKGLPFKTRGGRVYVRASDQHNLQRVLHEAGALPEGSLYDMATVVAADNPFESPEARKFKQIYAKGNELAKIIATSPAVKTAKVMINPEQKRRLGGRSDVPTASVNVALAPSVEMAPAMVEGLAKLVAGAVAGLKPYNVYITDTRTMRSYSMPHPDDPGSVDYLGKIKEHEAHYVSKIMDKLSDIPALRASVTVELDTSKSIKQTQTYDRPEPKSETEHTSEQSDGGQPTEPGVQANLGQAVTAAGAGGGNNSTETTTEFYPPNMNETVTVEKMPFGVTRITATVGIPRSFIVSVFKARTPDAPENPADSDPGFAAVRDEQVGRVRASVERIIMASADDVDVDVYPDMTWTLDGGGYATAPAGVVAAVSADSFDAMDMARSYGPQLGLALLALLSFSLMMRVVRKSSEALSGGAASGLGDDASAEEAMLESGAHTVGQASSSEGFLVGHELGEDVLRAQELNAEVARMVDEDPDGTAELIRRWVQDPA